MLKIGICDDEKIIIKMLKEPLEQCMEEEGIPGKITEFYSGEHLLAEYSGEEIIFLDIDMPGMDGIEVGKHIRRKRFDCKIIMATGMEECFKEAFKIEALRFVTKPFQKEEIKEALEAVLKTRIGIDEIELYRDRSPYIFRQNKILYVAAVNSATEFTLEEGVFRKKASLAELEKILDQRLFYRISKQYIINMEKVTAYKNGKILLRDSEMKVSVRKKKDFEKVYLEYRLNYS